MRVPLAADWCEGIGGEPGEKIGLGPSYKLAFSGVFMVAGSGYRPQFPERVHVVWPRVFWVIRTGDCLFSDEKGNILYSSRWRGKPDTRELLDRAGQPCAEVVWKELAQPFVGKPRVEYTVTIPTKDEPVSTAIILSGHLLKKPTWPKYDMILYSSRFALELVSGNWRGARWQFECDQTPVGELVQPQFHINWDIVLSTTEVLFPLALILLAMIQYDRRMTDMGSS